MVHHVDIIPKFNGATFPLATLLKLKDTGIPIVGIMLFV